MLVRTYVRCLLFRAFLWCYSMIGRVSGIIVSWGCGVLWPFSLNTVCRQSLLVCTGICLGCFVSFLGRLHSCYIHMKMRRLISVEKMSSLEDATVKTKSYPVAKHLLSEPTLARYIFFAAGWTTIRDISPSAGCRKIYHFASPSVWPVTTSPFVVISRVGRCRVGCMWVCGVYPRLAIFVTPPTNQYLPRRACCVFIYLPLPSSQVHTTEHENN